MHANGRLAVVDELQLPGGKVVYVVEAIHKGELVRAICPIPLRHREDVALVVRAVVEWMRSALNEATGNGA